MDKNTAEIIVKVYAILGWIGAAFMVLGGLGAMLGGSLLGAGMMGGYGAYPYAGMMGGAFAGFALVAGILMIAVAVLEAFAALGLWRHQEWARIILLIFSALGVLSILTFNIIGAAIGAVSIWLFGFEPTVTGLFGAKPFDIGSGKKK